MTHEKLENPVKPGHLAREYLTAATRPAFSVPDARQAREMSGPGERRG
jgi:hypothetical protein